MASGTLASKPPLAEPTDGGPTTEGSTPDAHLILASRSTRRRHLLADAGYRFTVADQLLDDTPLHPGVAQPQHWVMSLAYLKAAAAAGLHVPAPNNRQPVVVLAADTVCALPHGRPGEPCAPEQIVGQPEDAEHARAMLRSMSGRTHRVYTGVALIEPCGRRGELRRELFYDAAEVHFDTLNEAQIQRYLATGAWRGKAGAYNLTDRVDAGWPIRWVGDPTTEVGLPMSLLASKLAAFIPVSRS